MGVMNEQHNNTMYTLEELVVMSRSPGVIWR